MECRPRESFAADTRETSTRAQVERWRAMSWGHFGRLQARPLTVGAGIATGRGHINPYVTAGLGVLWLAPRD
jgi:hypothetical protein